MFIVCGKTCTNFTYGCSTMLKWDGWDGIGYLRPGSEQIYVHRYPCAICAFVWVLCNKLMHFPD